jgi:hypothetical protein
MRPLAPDVLAIVETHFREFYATRRRPTLTRFWAEVAADCRRQGCPVPSIRRLRRWVARQDEAELLRRREGRGKSEPVFLATPGKPVRPGLAALACGSLLQNYALAVSVARLTENPVERAAAALAAADAEGKTSLRRILESWPSATRRRIDAQLQRLMDPMSVAKNASGRGRMRRSFINYARVPQILAGFVP